jgi:isopenicillin-N N-acyltransferase-like protein
VTGRLAFLHLAGSPLDCGRAHGRGARPAIAENVALYLRRFQEDGRVDRDEIWRRASAYLQIIERETPAYAAEMRGIAEGARQDLLDIVAVNVRYEILYTEFVRIGLERELATFGAGGCTAFAVLPSRSSNGHLLIGQNWDWIPGVRGAVVAAHRQGLPESLGFTEAGIAGAKIGVNGAGIGLAINGLVTDKDSWSRLRKPFHVRCWEVLASRTLPDALRAVSGSERACSANFVVGAAGSTAEVVDIETAPDSEYRLSPEDGLLVHANHFTHPDAGGLRQPLADDRPSTFHRHARMQQLLGEATDKGRKVRVEDLKEILRDHDQTPNSICRHVDGMQPPNFRYETVVSAILDVDAREMFIASGPPCTARYRRYSLAA